MKCSHGMWSWVVKKWDFLYIYFLYSTGSHDTMTYCLDKSSAVSGNESKLVKFLSKCLPCIVHPIIMKWSTTQVTIVWYSLLALAKLKLVLQGWECTTTEQPAAQKSVLSWDSMLGCCGLTTAINSALYCCFSLPLGEIGEGIEGWELENLWVEIQTV